MGAHEGAAERDELERKSRGISGRSSQRTTFRVDLQELKSGTLPGEKPSTILGVASTGTLERGHQRVKTPDTKERVRKYQETLAEGLASAVQRGDYDAADMYEKQLGRLLKSIS